MQSWHRRYCTMRRDIVYYGDGKEHLGSVELAKREFFVLQKMTFILLMGNQYLVDILNRIKPL